MPKKIAPTPRVDTVGVHQKEYKLSENDRKFLRQIKVNPEV